MAQLSEQAVVKTRELQGHGNAPAPLSVGRLSPEQSDCCYRCGQADHTAAACRFKTAHCHNCNKIGHIAAVCRQKKQRSTPKSSIKGKKPRGIQSVRQGQESGSSEEDLGMKVIRCPRGKPMVMDLMLNGGPLTMELDTGAAVSLVSSQVLQSLLPGAKLRPSTAPLYTYSGDCLEVQGLVEVEVGYGTQQATLLLYVVQGTGPSLFGRNWMEVTCPDWESIYSVRSPAASLCSVLEQHREVFEGLGALKGHKAKIAVDSNARPRYCKARPIPYALREKVDQELDRLERGVIEPVQFADWVAPVVPVLKQDKKSLRLCGDFKLTQGVQTQQVPYPRDRGLIRPTSWWKIVL